MVTLVILFCRDIDREHAAGEAAVQVQEPLLAVVAEQALLEEMMHSKALELEVEEGGVGEAAAGPAVVGALGVLRGEEGAHHVEAVRVVVVRVANRVGHGGVVGLPGEVGEGHVARDLRWNSST